VNALREPRPGERVTVPADCINQAAGCNITQRPLVMRLARVDAGEVVLIDGTRYPIESVELETTAK
jgi:hypothetical protein